MRKIDLPIGPPGSDAERKVLSQGMGIARGPFGPDRVVLNRQKRSLFSVLKEKPCLSLDEIDQRMLHKLPKWILQVLLVWLVGKGKVMCATAQRATNPTVLRTVYWLTSHPPVMRRIS
ncbi:MAG: hypothetical protein H7839_08945 [Magnetococcus sp. YQC-5]